MSKEKKHALSGAEGLIPELRFPEFEKEGEWELTSIGSIGNFYYGKSAPKWSLSEDAPTLCVRYGELYTKFDAIISDVKSRTNIEPSNLKFSKGGEILVPRVGERPSDFAKNCCYLPFSDIAIGEMISVFETKEFPIFYTYYFRTLWREFAEVVEGQNVKNLYYVNLEPIKIGKTSYAEQEKIASCLSSLDELIAAHNDKLDVLKEHKKGLMQNLFPQDGETVPKVRFPEFVNDGKWAEKSFEDLFEIGNGKDYKHLAEGNIPVYGSGGFMLSVNDYLYDGESACIGRKGTINKPLFLTGKFWTVDTLFYTHSFNDCLPKFIYYIFQNINWLRHNQAGGVPSLSKTNIYKIETNVPKPIEQKKIVNFLSGLDELITIQANKIEQLQQHKKGLMQGLFPKMKS